MRFLVSEPQGHRREPRVMPEKINPPRAGAAILKFKPVRGGFTFLNEA